jgi:membrane protease YdiL (CAAX protease family)
MGMLIFGLEDQFYEYAVVFLIIAAIICIPIYYRMYRKDWENGAEEKRMLPMENKDYLAIIICGAAIAVAMNNIISVTPLTQMFDAYEETNEVLARGGMVLQIISAGILGCIVEEISMRGVTYLRMRRYWGKNKAIFWSAIVFGIYHLNVVQAVYAFFLGLFFVWLYERYDSLWASILGHISANLFVILLSESGLFDNVYQSIVSFCLTTCIAILIFYYGFRWMKQTNPLMDLEFVKKDPDTLESLTKEYKEQEREE